MKRIALGILIFSLLGVALFVRLPLGAVLTMSGLEQRGLNWSHVRGTAWNGQVLGLAHSGQELGALSLKLKPARFMRGQVTYKIKWVGPQGMGSGDVTAFRNGFVLKGMRATVSLADIEGIQPMLRQSGGSLIADVQEIKIGREGCLSAFGRLETDAVKRLGIAYNRQWPDLSGEIACDDGVLVLPLKGDAVGGETFSIVTRLQIGGASETLIRINGLDGEAILTLMEFGFEKSPDNALVFREEFLAQ